VLHRTTFQIGCIDWFS